MYAERIDEEKQWDESLANSIKSDMTSQLYDHFDFSNFIVKRCSCEDCCSPVYQRPLLRLVTAQTQNDITRISMSHLLSLWKKLF